MLNKQSLAGDAQLTSVLGDATGGNMLQGLRPFGYVDVVVLGVIALVIVIGFFAMLPSLARYLKIKAM